MNERDWVQVQTKRKSPFNRGGGELCACLSSETHDAAVAFCYDGYNQRGHEEVSMTLRSAMTGTEGNDAGPKIAFGINPAESGMMIATNPPTKECSKPLRKSPGGENGIIEVTASGDGVVTLKGVTTPYGRPDFYKHQNIGKKTNNVGELIEYALNEMRYIVRRLTPKEAERLMGLPDGYTIPTGLRRFFDANGEPSPELVSEFVDIFNKFNAIMADYEHRKPPKGKSYNQVAEWLKKISNHETCPDSPRYKGCGNGWATNQPRWILTRMLSMEGIEW